MFVLGKVDEKIRNDRSQEEALQHRTEIENKAVLALLLKCLSSLEESYQVNYQEYQDLLALSHRIAENRHHSKTSKGLLVLGT